MRPQTRSAIKAVAAAVAGLLGIGLFLEGAFTPGNGGYLIVFAVAAVTWGNMHLSDRQAARDKAVCAAFGASEDTLRSTYGLSDARVTELLNDPSARSAFIERIRKAVADV